MKQNSGTIQRFIKAKSPKRLEVLMMLNNTKRQSYHKYQIVFDGKEWFAWYEVSLEGLANQDLIEVGGDKE